MQRLSSPPTPASLLREQQSQAVQADDDGAAFVGDDADGEGHEAEEGGDGHDDDGSDR